MRISNKIIATVGLVALVIVLIFYPIQDWWMAGNFDRIEQQEVESEINHTINGVNFDLMSLKSVSLDYAEWDDTYSFVQNYSEEYVMSNLVTSTFVNQRLDIIVIANSTGNILFARGYDHEQDNLTEIPADLASRLVAGSPLLPSPGNSTLGLVASSDGFLMVSAAPVLRSDLTGPPMGTLLMGRYLDQQEIGIIESISGTSMSLQPRDAGSGPAPDGFPQIKDAGNNNVTGQRVISDIYGQPAAVLSISLPHPFLAEEQARQRFSIVMIIVASVLGSLIFLLLIKWIIVSPLRKLSDSVARIGRDHDPAQRVPVTGDDELSLLADVINRMLDALEGSRQQLQDKEQRFRNLVENINDVIWETDADLKLTYLSPQARDVMGYEPEAVLGRSPFELVDTGEREQIRATIDDMIARKGSFDLVEFTIARPDGITVDFEICGNPIRDPAGKIAGYRGVARDISDRKRAEEHLANTRLDLERSLKFTEALLSAIPTPVFYKGRDGRYIGCNRAFSDLMGVTADEIKGKTVFDLWPGEQAAVYHQKDLELMENPAIQIYEYKVRDKNGKDRAAIYVKNVFRDENEEVAGIVGAFLDITDRKQAEEALKKLSQVVKESPSTVVITDIHGNIEYVNRKFSELTGYTFEEAKGKNPRVLKSGHTTQEEYRQLWKTILSGKEWRGEFLNKKKNGELYWEWSIIFPIVDAGGTITNLIAVKEDITERKRAEDQIKASLAEKDVLLKEIHHRVKNNLQIISSLLSLQSEQISSENPAKTFRESQDRIRSMALIHEKLYQSKDLSRVDFSEYVRSLTAYLSRSYFTRPGIEIVIDVRDISLDVDKAIPCGLIINELVSNALKYAFPGDRGGKIRIGLAKSDGTYTLTVSDDGVGLPPGMDFRNTPSLGLQLVNTLVSQLEGTIELDGSHGTTFRITFVKNMPGFTPPS